MKLNLPILHLLENSQNILIAGAGGGFDVFGGLPIYFALSEMGKTVHLANYSFSEPHLVGLKDQLTFLGEYVIGARGKVGRILPYYGEGYLAEWFAEIYGEDVTIWMFPRPGAEPLRLAYETLIEHLGIDALILVDGGVDSLMRGDEEKPGTLIEDSITLSAAKLLRLPVKILATLGFGTETEVCHHHTLENISALTKAQACLGACALTAEMNVFQLYEAATRYVMEQPVHEPSYIHARIISGVHGEFGNFHLYPNEHSWRYPVFVSPLNSLYWFFDVETVCRCNLLAEALIGTTSIRAALQIYSEYRRLFKIRPAQRIPY
jgi:hypothetical protein